MTYRDTIAWLFELQMFGVKLGLENISTLLRSFDSPQLAAPSVLITGSNGKGSVAAMVTAAVRQHGVRVGTYTSPHLVWVEERIQIDGIPTGRRDLCRVLDHVRLRILELRAEQKLIHHPTFFEVITVAAFLEFRRRRVELMVLEVGMGGRFDATNAAAPAVSAVTNVALEHTRYLGATVAAIALEKAGVGRRGRPFVIGVGSGKAYRTLVQRAGEGGMSLVVAPRRVRVSAAKFDRNGLRADLTTARGDYPTIRLPLPGQHQIRNLQTAIALLESLPPELLPPPGTVARGLRSTAWPGRLEYVAGRPRLLLDGAHNPHAARVLARYLATHERGRRVLLFGCLADKDIAGLLHPIGRLCEDIVLVPIASSRSASLSDLSAVAARLSARIHLAPSSRKGLELARDLARSAGLVIACGSLYLVGELKARIARTERQQLHG